MAPAVLPWPALRSLLDAVGFAIAVSVSVAKQSTDSVPRVSEEKPFCFGVVLPIGATPVNHSQSLWKLRAATKTARGRGKEEERQIREREVVRLVRRGLLHTCQYSRVSPPSARCAPTTCVRIVRRKTCTESLSIRAGCRRQTAQASRHKRCWKTMLASL